VPYLYVVTCWLWNSYLSDHWWSACI